MVKYHAGTAGLSVLATLAGFTPVMGAPAAPPTKPITYTYQTVAVPNDGDGLAAYGIDAAGDIVGNYIDSSRVQHAFMYSKGQLTDLAPPNVTFSASNATFVTESGVVVGNGTTSTGHVGFELKGGTYSIIQPSGKAAPMIYLGGAEANGAVAGYDANSGNFFVEKHKKFSTIFNLPGSQGNTVVGMNNHGTVIGNYIANGGGVTSGFVALDGGPGVTLQIPNSGGGVLMTGVNSSDVAVGLVASATGYHPQGFQYTAGQLTYINYPAASQTAALGINDSGTIVGYGVATSGDILPFTLSSKGVFTPLSVPNAFFPIATAINKAGVVVGTDFNSSTFAQELFIATPVK